MSPTAYEKTLSAAYHFGSRKYVFTWKICRAVIIFIKIIRWLFAAFNSQMNIIVIGVTNSLWNNTLGSVPNWQQWVCLQPASTRLTFYSLSILPKLTHIIGMPIFTGLSKPKTNRCFNAKIQDTDLSPLLLSKKVRKFIIVVVAKKLPEYLLQHYKDPYVSNRCQKFQLSTSNSLWDLDARL